MELRLFSNRGQYRTTYLAFIDILGFKNVLHLHCLNTPNYLLRIFSAADRALVRDESHGIKKMFLSDSIVMWTEHRSAIPFLLENCDRLQEQLFLKGHLVRGAIVKDKHYSGDLESFNTRISKRLSFPNHIIVSPALIKAFITEQKLGAPFIKAEGAVLNDIPRKMRSAKARRKHYHNRRFYYGRDYAGHFSYLLQLVTHIDTSWKGELTKEFRRVMRLRNMVENNLQTYQGDVLNKWTDVAKRFNRCAALVNKESSDKNLFIPRIKTTTTVGVTKIKTKVQH